MKEGNSVRLGTLRMLESALHNKELERRAKAMKENAKATEKDWELTDEEVLSVVKSEAKKRKEAIEQYQQGGRDELAEKEKSELKVLEAFMPEQLSKEAVQKEVADVISRLGGSASNKGMVMREVMQKLKGKADGSQVAAAVDAMLEKA